MHNAWIICLVALCTVTAATINWNWKEQCNNCKCFWSNGQRTADCTNIKLDSIPKDLTSDLRQIDFSYNALRSLDHEAMSKANLHHVNKLRFQNCSLDVVRSTAFNELHLLIELDLSRNFITWLDKQTFKDNLKLRVLSISHNNLMILDEGLFHDLAQLQTLRLHHNQIGYVAEKAFVQLPELHHLDLGFNEIPTIYHDFTVDLGKLDVLNLEGNPWVCDCNLEDFRNKMIKDNLIGVSTECAEPKGELWNSNDTFSCLPLIEPEFHLDITLDNDMQITSIGSNVTLTCKVSGEPQPNVEWVRNDRLDTDEKQKFNTSKGNDGEYTWINLTITNVGYRDRGIYKCVAKNSKGTIEKKLTLVVPSESYGIYIFYIYAAVYAIIYAAVYAVIHADLLTLIMFAIGGIFVSLATIIVLIKCCCKDGNNGSIESEMDKSNLDTVLDLPVIPPSFSFSLEDSIRSSHELHPPLLNAMCDQVDSILSQLPVFQLTPRMPYHRHVIPGRSRQSWSSIVSSITNAINYQEYYVMRDPIYDNLGLRTSANGSSAWSLDMLGVNVTPKSCDIFQASNCYPIEEQEDSTTATDDNSTGSNAEALHSCPYLDEMNLTKIPPVPPPKPKKRPGPLLEDEDEDGTEV